MSSMSFTWGLQNKPTNNRRNRPAWALNDKSLMVKCVGKRAALRFQVAQMYWQKNMTSQDIAKALELTHGAVRMILNRLVTVS